MFNMASKPARRTILFDVIKPNSDVEDCGRLDGGEYPSTENQKTAATTSEARWGGKRDMADWATTTFPVRSVVIGITEVVTAG